MTKKIINQVQDYLTVVGEDKVYQIIDVGILLKRHPPEAVISFLQQLRREYSKTLSGLIKNDKTDPHINELIIKNFRLKMAINTIRNAEQVRQTA